MFPDAWNHSLPRFGDACMKLFRACVLFSVPLFCRAEVRLPHVISDHAVLQRDRPIHLWGWATPGAHLQLSFHGQTIAAEVDPLGKWSAWLAPEPAGGPYVLSITGDGAEVRVDDLLVGDVWFASGQSNMEFPLAGFDNAPLKDSAREIAAATNPRLRLLHIGTRSSDYPLDDDPATWTDCTPETATHFSAVAYFFGREIAARENVPVGLIDSTWGGTPADSWVSLDTLGTNPDLLPAFASRARFADKQADVPAVLAEEKREDAAAKAAGQPVPTHPWHPSETSWLPAGLYNGMVAPFTPYSLKGFLWYQGETNSGPDRAQYYRSLFPALIGDWRAHFNQGTLPFLYVQISSFNSPGENWGEIRDAQRRTLSVANTAMAVTTDIGERDNVHPPDKQTVGARLALAARGLVYGENVAYQPPLFREATTETQANGTVAMRVWFDHAERLTAKTAAVSGFELAGDDHHFVPAEARIDGSTVMVSAAAVAHPVYVRYAWAGYSPDGLYNAAGLPASTFTSDNSPFR
jgi:sialate O-acetylesterase